MHRWGPRGVGAAVTAILLLGTSCGSVGGSDGTAPDAVRAPEASAPTTEPAPEPPTRPEPAPDPPAPEDCEPATRERITSTVTTQVEAFAEEDFDRALDDERTSLVLRLGDHHDASSVARHRATPRDTGRTTIGPDDGRLDPLPKGHTVRLGRQNRCHHARAGRAAPW